MVHIVTSSRGTSRALRSATTTKTGERDRSTPSVDTLTAPTSRRIWPTGRAWCNAITVHVSVLLTAKTMAPASKNAGYQTRGGAGCRRRASSWPARSSTAAARLKETTIWARLKRTLTKGLWETTSPTRTTEAAMRTAVSGGPTSNRAIMKVQLAVTWPPPSRPSQRKGRSSVNRQQAPKMARIWGRGPSSPCPREAHTSYSAPHRPARTMRETKRLTETTCLLVMGRTVSPPGRL